MPTKTTGHAVKGKNVSGDEAIKKVIDAKAECDRLRREIKAMKKDREDLLSEYTDAVKARRIKKFRPVKRKQTAKDRVRVCVGDIHGMRMDRPAVDAFLTDLANLDPDEIVVGGDLLECGGWLAKHQPIGFIALSDYSYQEDIQAANWVLDQMAAAAPNAELHYLEGNHEDRVERWIVDQVMANGRDADFLYQAFSPRTLLRLEERGIAYYRRSETYVEGCPRGWIKRGKMYFTHTLGKGKSAARNAAQKTAGNVTYFCTHREDTATLNLPAIGLVKAFNPGCLCTLQPVWMNSDPTDWSHGYGIDIVSPTGNFQRIHVPISKGESLASAMLERF